MNKNWKPEIFYEDYSKSDESKSITSGLPFINVPKDHNMPGVLFICEARDISEEDNELEKQINYETNKQLTQYSLIYYNKIKYNQTGNEL